MATFKSYTDLEQSKVLAEILPHESADAIYYYHPKLECSGGWYEFSHGINKINHPYDIPCWSLTALLGVLPRIDIEKEICSDDTFDYRVKAYIGDGYIGDWFDSPVDACYEMILKLHEFKML